MNMSTLISPLMPKTLLALSDALENCFDTSDWARLGLELDHPSLQDPGSRLRKSLSWGDDDYGACVVQIVRDLQDENPSALRELATRPKLKNWLVGNTPVAAQELGLGQAQVAAPPTPPSASQAIELALRDAEHLLHTNGATSCVDRMHTALHGYVREEAAKASLPVADDANLPALFKALRNCHPRLQANGPHGAAVSKVLISLASCVDTLNSLRNNATPAHPNKELLDEAEAMLAVNAVRSIFNYLGARLSGNCQES